MAAAAVAGHLPHIEPPTGDNINPHFTEIPSNSTWVSTLLRYLSYAALALPIAAVAALCIYLFFQLSLVIAILTAICALAGGVVGSVFLYKWLSDWSQSSASSSKHGIEWHQHYERWKLALEKNDNHQLNDVEKAFFNIPGMDEPTLRSNLDKYLVLVTWLSFFLKRLEQATQAILAASAGGAGGPNSEAQAQATIFQATLHQWKSALAFNELRRLFNTPQLHTKDLSEVVDERGLIDPIQGFGLLRAGIANPQHLAPFFVIHLPKGTIPIRLTDLTPCQPHRVNDATALTHSLELLENVHHMVDAIREVPTPPAPPQS